VSGDRQCLTGLHSSSDRPARLAAHRRCAGAPSGMAGLWHVAPARRRTKTPFTHLAADLTDLASCQPRAGGNRPNHPCLLRRPRAVPGRRRRGLSKAMSRCWPRRWMPSRPHRSSMSICWKASSWYGMHLGPYPTPSREDDPPASVAEFLLRPAGFVERRSRGEGALELVGVAAVLYLRLRAQPRAKT